MKRIFNVLMDEAYVRDTQMLYTKEMDDDGIERILSSVDDSGWGDMEPTPYIDTVSAASASEACRIAGEKRRYDPRVLYAIEVEGASRSRQLLAALIDNELKARCNIGDFVKSLSEMGFTEEDFDDLGMRYLNDLKEDKNEGVQ